MIEDVKDFFSGLITYGVIPIAVMVLFVHDREREPTPIDQHQQINTNHFEPREKALYYERND